MPPGGGEIVGDSADRRVEILSDPEPLHATWSRFGPRRDGADLHVHREHTDAFYVLEGELTFTAGDAELRVEAGSWVQVPPGVPHTFSFTGTRPARFLDLHTPSCGFGAFVRGLHHARTDEELSAVRAAFDQLPA